MVTAHGAQRLHRAISHTNSASAWPEAARADWESVKRPQTKVPGTKKGELLAETSMQDIEPTQVSPGSK